MKKINSFLAVLIAIFFVSGIANSQSADVLIRNSNIVPQYIPYYGMQSHLNTDFAVLYNNGPMINSAHTVGGYNVSILRSPMTTYGPNNANSGFFRVADEFTVPVGGWTIDSIYTYGYQTGSTLTSSFTSVNFRIWNGIPNAIGSTVVFGDTTTNRLVRTAFSGIYRVSSADSNNTQRPIMLNVLGLGSSVVLPAGTYWLDWTSSGSIASGPWVPHISITGQTTTGNAKQRAGGVWNDLTDGGTLTPQGLPFVLHGSVPAPPSGNDSTLVMFHDTTITGGQVKRLADRDSVMKYIPSLISKYKTFYFNATTALPDLTNYKTVILVETSFDNSGALFLGPAARTSLKNWLASGTPSDKKSLISIGGDQGYNYDRTGAASLDTGFSRTYGGYIYRQDDVYTVATNVTGVAITPGVVRTIAPPTGTGNTGYWPDGCGLAFGATALFKFDNRTANDTLSGVGRLTPGFISITSFQDPRFFTNNNLKPWLASLIAYVVTNGGTITNVTTPLNVVAEKYSLSQNYPNPLTRQQK